MASTYAQAEVATETTIRELITVSGQEESIRLSTEALVPALKKMVKDVPEEKLRELFNSERIVASIVVPYQKYFTEEEVRDMLAFYKTPSGAKLAKLNTKIQREAAGLLLQSWRMSLINEQIQQGNFTIQQPELRR